jgi:signal transduction histidine kinase
LSGNGLGLAIVKELLALYGGEIRLESKLDQGTCFIIHLPLLQQSAEEGTTQNNG